LKGPNRSLVVVLGLLALAATRCTLANSLDYLHDGTAAADGGPCGHDCQGGTCQAGACQPVTLASGWPSAFDLALDSTSVYFTVNDSDAGAVVRCSQGGCDAGMTVLASGEDGPTRIALDATRAYWTAFAGSYVHACALGGCGGVPAVIATGQTNAEGIAVDSTSVYWDQNVNGTGLVLSCPVTGCPASGPTVLDEVAGPGTIAVNGPSLFWVANPHGAVDECPITGCDGGATIFAGGGSSTYSPYFVVTYGGLVYWTDDETAGGIYACPLSGCAGNPAQIAAENGPLGLAVDASGVYWSTDSPLGVIRRCPLTGCNGAAPETLAVAQDRPFAVKLGDRSVFWTNRGDGTVMKVAKPVTTD
jgi:hypothetical protein